jgi:hypothetical protein
MVKVYLQHTVKCLKLGISFLESPRRDALEIHWEERAHIDVKDHVALCVLQLKGLAGAMGDC